MELIIVRHGETRENVTKTIQGQTSGSGLTEKGVQQAEQAAEALRGAKISTAYSSDLERTRQTAEIIASKNPVQFILTPLLRERSYGEYEGKPTALLDEWAKKEGKNRYLIEPAGGETLEEFYLRIKEFLTQLAKTHKDGETILLVTHKGAISMIHAIIKGTKPIDAMSITQGNAEVARLALPSEIKNEKIEKKTKVRR